MRTRIGKLFSGTHLDYGTNDGHVCNRLFSDHPRDNLYVADVANFLSPRLAHLGSRFIKVDLATSQTEAPPDFFDSVSCIHVLEHVPQPLAVLREFTRILKHGGLCYIETPNNRSVLTPSLRLGVTCNFFDDPTHIRPYSATALTRLCKQAGLTVLSAGIERNWIYAAALPLSPFVSLILLDAKPLYYSMIHAIGWSSYVMCRRE